MGFMGIMPSSSLTERQAAVFRHFTVGPIPARIQRLEFHMPFVIYYDKDRHGDRPLQPPSCVDMVFQGHKGKETLKERGPEGGTKQSLR